MKTLLALITLMAATVAHGDITREHKHEAVGNAKSTNVELVTPDKLIAHADYRVGDPDKPAILLLHGFLQTNGSYQTLISLKSELHDAGYTVLAPTLTLGISNRQQSLECESVHTHTIEQDTKEIEMWVEWLQKKHKNIHVVGHSFGNINLLAYLSSDDRPVDKFVALSIISFKKQAYDKQLPKVQMDLTINPDRLQNYQIAYCKKYVSPAKTMITYLRWTNTRILENMAITTKKHTSTVIVGSEDKRIDNQWIDGIKASKANMVVIDGANHFFTGEHEFDIVDSVLETLQ